MSYIKLSISFLFVGAIIGSCSQADTSQCACLAKAKEVNRLSKIIWSSGASHQDTIQLKAALEQKDKLCKKLQELDPESLIEIKSACQQ